MNVFIHDLLSCLLQVTIFCSGTLLLYFIARRFDRRMAISVLLTSLCVVASLTAIVAVPNSHWSWRWPSSGDALGQLTAAAGSPVLQTDEAATALIGGSTTSDPSLPPFRDLMFSAATATAGESPDALRTTLVTESGQFLARRRFSWQTAVLLGAGTALVAGLVRLLLAGLALERIDARALRSRTTASSNRRRTFRIAWE